MWKNMFIADFYDINAGIRTVDKTIFIKKEIFLF